MMGFSWLNTFLLFAAASLLFLVCFVFGGGEFYPELSNAVKVGDLAFLSPKGVRLSQASNQNTDWGDRVSVGPASDIWLTDSRLTEWLDQSRNPSSQQARKEMGPFAFYQIKHLETKKD